MQPIIAQAFEHFRADRLEEARLLIVECVRADRTDSDALNLLGMILHRQGRSQDAGIALMAAVQVRPDALPPLFNLAFVLRTQGFTGQAGICFRRALVLEPASAPALSWLGALAQEEGNLEKALLLLRRATRLGQLPRDAANAAVAAIGNGRLVCAVEWLRTALTIDPTDAYSYELCGKVFMTVGDLDGADRAFAHAHTLNPTHLEALQGRIRVGRYRRAQRAQRGQDGDGLLDGLVVRGHFAGISGYAHMTDRFVDGLLRRSLPIDLMGLFGSETWKNGPLRPPVRARAALSFLTPELLERIPGFGSVLFTMFEGTRISPAWRRLSENADLVVVPTRASWEAWASRGFPEARLRLCPLGVDPLPAVTAADFPTSGLPSSLADIRGRPLSAVSRRILNISDLVPRKNLDGLLRVWLRATVAADDAVLILKFGKGSGAAQAAFQSLLRASETAVGRRLDEAAPIAVIDETLDEDGMNGLFRVATHYWSLSHGEGWDLPMSKAGAMGLELVAPRHSAYPEYLDDSTARLIPSTTGPAHRPYSRESWAPFFSLDWWEPDEDVAADIIGRIVRGEDDRRLDARSHLLARFTWDHATDALLTLLRDCRAL